MRPLSLFIIGFLYMAMLTSCGQQQTSDPSTGFPSIPKLPKRETDPEKDRQNLVLSHWEQAHFEKDSSLFAEAFAEKVNYYGTTKTKKEIIAAKMAYFKKHPDFEMIVQMRKQKFSEKRVDFIKTVKQDGKTDEYPSYLVFEEQGGKWRIVTEGDKITDANLARKAQLANAEKIEGDFNGDGSLETMWLVEPKFAPNESMDCVGECKCKIQFSNKAIPAINVPSCIGGTPVNEGDLNGDGADEVGILPDWWTSCWRAYYVFTFRNGKWKNAIDPISTHCNQWEEGYDAIVVDPNKKGNAIIHYSEFNDEEGIFVKSGSMPVDK